MGSMTLEDAMALLDKWHAQNMAEIREAGAAAVATAVAERAKWEAEMAATVAAAAVERAKWEAEIAAKREADRKAEEAEDARVERRMKQLERLTGSLQRDYSELTEIILRPKMFEKINKCGHKFTILVPNMVYKDRNGKYITEVDLLLRNCEEAMIIEVKADWKVKYVGELLQKLKLLRKNEAMTEMVGKTMYAAISGITVSEKVRDLALSRGIYVMTMHEDEDRVDVVQPSQRGTW
jgi:hypothetical protein